jgi:hypothetical protein
MLLATNSNPSLKKHPNTQTLVSKISTKLYKHKKLQTYPRVCFIISNHQKWFENIHQGIISQTPNSSNLIHTRTSSKLTHIITLAQLKTNLIMI